MAGDNTVKMKKVWDVSKQLELIKGESASGWTAGTDVTALTTSTTHKTGANSISYAKSGTTVTTGTISKTSLVKNGNLFALHKMKAFINLSSLADVASVDIVIGTDASNNNVYRTLDTALSTGFNELDFDNDSPTSVTGAGINWYNINYVAVTVNFDAVGNTLTDILVDTIQLYKIEESGGSVSSNIKITGPLGLKSASESVSVVGANFDSSSGANKVFEIAPIWTNHVEETLADVTNETNATNFYFIDFDGYKHGALQIEIDAGAVDTTTVTFEMSIQDDGTAAASATYQDVTSAFFGVASITADNILIIDTPIAAKFFRVKTVTAGGNNDADYTLFWKKLY